MQSDLCVAHITQSVIFLIGVSTVHVRKNDEEWISRSPEVVGNWQTPVSAKTHNASQATIN